MTLVKEEIDLKKWENLDSRDKRKIIAKALSLYKREEEVEVKDSQGIWGCLYDGDFRERRLSSASQECEVAILEDAREDSCARVSIYPEAEAMVFVGRGSSVTAESLHGFASLIESYLEEEPTPSLRKVLEASISAGRGLVEKGPYRGAWHAVLEYALSDPYKIAIEDDNTSMSYRQLALDAISNARLVTNYVRTRSKIALIEDRGISSAVAQLAIVLADCSVVLIDPALPFERKKMQIEQSNSCLVLSSIHSEELLKLCKITDTEYQEIRLGNPAEGIDISDEIEKAPDLNLDATSHVAFTSGSTGTPKAVELRHGPMANTAVAISSATGLSQSARASWFCAPGVGLVEVDLFPTLWSGGTVVIAPDSIGSDPHEAWAWIENKSVTHAQLPTALAEQLIKISKEAPEKFQSLRIAGERLNVWPEQSVTYQVLNVYGSTEANVVSLCDVTQLVQSFSATPRDTVPVGTPVRNVNMYVLDENLDPLPFGAVGELCISGKSISRGYMNNSQQQRERFIKNPIEGDPFPVLYRSGDLARFGVYGMIEVVGRIDDEVKVNGMRVHPAEIDRELLALEEISVAATIAIPTNSGSFVLVAYVEGSKPIDINKAKAHLEKRLPPSFVPTHIIESTIPRSRNGKVNRKELRDRPLLRPNIETPFETPTNEKELSICMFFSEVLGVENVGTEDNFFDLGGGSLQAAQLIERFKNTLGTEISFLMVMDNPTPSGLARATEHLTSSRE